MSSQENNLAVANTILMQLSGGTRRLALMCGAKNFVAIDNGITFKIGRNDAGITHVTITLDPSDTYTMRFQRVWGTKVTEKGAQSDVYCDMLRPVFERVTGMFLTL